MSSAPSPAEPDGPSASPAQPSPRPRLGLQQAAPAVLAVAGLLLAAIALRPEHGLVRGGSGLLSGRFALVVGLILVWLVGAGTVRRRYRAAVSQLHDLPARTARLKEAALVLLTGAVLVVPALLFLASSRGPDQAPPPPEGPTSFPPRSDTPTPVPMTTYEPRQRVPSARHYGLMTILSSVVTISLVLLVVIGLVFLWRQLRRLPRLAPQPPAPRGLDSAGLVEAVGSGRRALLGDDARAAVIACYAAMEQSLGESGVARHVSDSPTDLLERAVADGAVRRADVRVLTALFHEARYSSHPMDQTQLRLARAALDAIADQLAARTAAEDVAVR